MFNIYRSQPENDIEVKSKPQVNLGKTYITIKLNEKINDVSEYKMSFVGNWSNTKDKYKGNDVYEYSYITGYTKYYDWLIRNKEQNIINISIDKNNKIYIPFSFLFYIDVKFEDYEVDDKN